MVLSLVGERNSDVVSGRMMGFSSLVFAKGPSIQGRCAAACDDHPPKSRTNDNVVYCNVPLMRRLAFRVVPHAGLVVGLLAACAHPRSGASHQVADTTHRGDSTFGGNSRREVVTSDQIRKDQPIEESLSGRFPGVEVSRTS